MAEPSAPLDPPDVPDVKRGRSKTQRNPFEVELSEEKELALVDFLTREINEAMQARTNIVGDDGRIDQAHLMYEGGNGSLTKDTPWVGAANLGSWIVTEKVDSMRARIVATVFTDPIWIVEGFGKDAERAPLVEAFHQWKAQETRLEQSVVRMVHNSLIEGTGVLEVSDRVVQRKGRRKIRALLQQNPADGTVQLGDDGAEVPVRMAAEGNPDVPGAFVEAEPGEPFLEMIVDEVVRASAGPSYRVLSLKHFFQLPGHATEREDVWGYAKRVHRRLPELQCRERDGYYRNIDQLGKSDERLESTGAASDQPRVDREGQTIAQAYDKTAEKEVWEVTLLADLDEDGYEEWYIVTLSLLHRTLMRLQYQDYDTPHYKLYTPFPRPNSVWGYSYAYDKLGSLYDEHSAVRNMFADRSVLAVNAPFKVVQGSLAGGKPLVFGPRQTIFVRDLKEIEQLEVKDVPQSVMAKEQQILSAAERISGQNDTSTGHLAQQDRTLGEVKITTEQSFVRTDETIKNFQEGMEQLFDLLQIIWMRKLEQAPEALPGEILSAMSGLGIEIPNKMVTHDLLAGTFRGKPQNSVEGADFSKMKQDFAAMITAVTQLSQAVPAVAMHLNNPQVIRSIMSQLARIYRWPDRANLVGTFTGQVPMMPGMPGQPPPPGMPPGMPPAPPGPPQNAPMAGGAPNVPNQ